MLQAVFENIAHRGMPTVQMPVRSAWDILGLFLQTLSTKEIKQTLESGQRTAVYSKYKDQAAEPKNSVLIRMDIRIDFQSV